MLSLGEVNVAEFSLVLFLFSYWADSMSPKCVSRATWAGLHCLLNCPKFSVSPKSGITPLTRRNGAFDNLFTLQRNPSFFSYSLKNESLPISPSPLPPHVSPHDVRVFDRCNLQRGTFQKIVCEFLKLSAVSLPLHAAGKHETRTMTAIAKPSNGTNKNGRNIFLLGLAALSGCLLRTDVSRTEGSNVVEESDNPVISSEEKGKNSGLTGFSGLEFFWQTFDVIQLSVARGLDWIRESTGAPWWLTLVTATLAVRCLLLPLTLTQVKKSSQLALLGPRLPPPFPVLGSNKTLREAWKAYSEKAKELGAPSLVWIVALPLVQVPLFITWLTSLRRMALSEHPGFETGGMLWFTNLTEPGYGVLGSVFPVLIGFTYLATVQVSFRGIQSSSSQLSTLVMAFKWVLQFLTLPTVWAAMVLPQGTHMYWLANNAFSLTQTVALKSPRARSMLGLPLLATGAVQKPSVSPLRRGTDTGEGAGRESEAREREMEGADVSLLTAEELVKLAAERRAEGKMEDAIRLLKVSVKKEETFGPSHVALGQLNMELSRFTEAVSSFREAVKRVPSGEAFLLSHIGLGVALENLGRREEALESLEVVTRVTPPVEPRSLKRYVRALLIKASLFSKMGRKKEALDWLKKAAVYEPQIQKIYVEPLEKELKEMA